MCREPIPSQEPTAQGVLRGQEGRHAPVVHRTPRASRHKVFMTTRPHTEGFWDESIPLVAVIMMLTLH
jgi:hypothetical protein